jgi:hypothetical protein
VVDPRCIIYNGPDIPCYGIETGDSAADILNIIISYFNCPPTTTTTTSSGTTTTTTSSTPTTTTTTTGGGGTTTTTTSALITTSTTSSSTTTSTTSTSTTSSTTTTTAPTTTTTTGEPVPKSNFAVDNQLSFGGAEITDITFNSTSVTLDLNYPITSGQGAIGNENNGVYTIEVFFTGVLGTEVVSITDSSGSTVCSGLFLGQNSQVFLFQTLDDTLLPPVVFTIGLKEGPC